MQNAVDLGELGTIFQGSGLHTFSLLSPNQQQLVMHCYLRFLYAYDIIHENQENEEG